MRITFVCPPFDMGGGQRVIALYAASLEARGHKVLVVAPPLRPRRLHAKIQSAVKERRLPWRRPKDQSHFDRHFHLTKVLDRYRPVGERDVPNADVVIATWWETAEWVSLMSPEKGVKCYFVQHHEVFQYLPVERVEATLRADFQKITIAPWCTGSP